ncbi:hypothetical protein R3W88_026359 [Solanum pinnatisectum]|uniref:BHLH domain-containing protein n=1 Tax=Solanum pinnatisectum TaxID=50273 RepID=A0AAV9LCY5_9SOLN|nr:hypothetical protein R3W88_026359 [Solanum pinnatisectum]
MERRMKSKLPPAGPKMERKYVEKNRRNYMKNLYNQLHSLLPTTHASTSKETMTVPNQIDAAVNYIENLKINLEKNKKQLEELKMGLMRAQSFNPTNDPGPTIKSTPQIEFHEMGPNMVVVLITSLNNIATINNIIRLCHEEGVEVMSTSFQLNGNSTLQISHETKKMININSRMEFKATTLYDKMKELIYGATCSNDMECSQIHLWDYIIEFDELEVLSITPSQNPSNYMQNVEETPSFLWD